MNQLKCAIGCLTLAMTILWMAPSAVAGDLAVDGAVKAVDTTGVGLRDKDDVPGVWVKDGGNVGIGTTTPSEKLEVAGEMAVDGAVKAVDGTGVGLKDDGDNIGVWVKDGGNVGIGTTNPSAKLEVIGQITADQINLGDEEEITWMGSETLKYSDNAMEFLFSKGIQSTSGNITAASDLQANGDAYIGISTADSKLWYHDTEYLMWDNYPGTFILSDDLYVAGKVGIGTASPSEELDVDGDAYFSGDVKVNGTLDYNGGSDPPYILWFDETREHVAQLCKATIPESRKNGLVQFYNSVQDRIEYLKPANGKVYIQDGGALIEQATLDGGPFYNTNVIPRYIFNRHTGEVMRFDKSNTKQYEVVEGCELDDITGEFVDAEGAVVSSANAIRKKTDDELTSETLIEIKERMLEKDLWVEIEVADAWEMVEETTEVKQETETTEYQLDLATETIVPVKVTVKETTKVPTGNYIRQLKKGVRFDKKTGKLYRRRAIDEVQLPPEL